MIGPTVLAAVGAEVLAELAVLAAAVSYALAGIYGRRFRGMGVSPLATATGQVTASTLLLFPLALAGRPAVAAACPGACRRQPRCSASPGSRPRSPMSIYFRLLARVGATNLLLVDLPDPGLGDPARRRSCSMSISRRAISSAWR